MSPEQVQGGAATIGPSADIYGLGVTLYELLALHVPFAAASDELTKRKIVEGRPIALRARNPALSADVEVVCATAMDLEPARRYASAEAFARDLSNVLEHRPIEARPAGAMIRTRRWVERHPGWAAAGALSFIALTIGPLAFALQARDARVRIEKQRDAAEANRVRAENNFQSALEAVDLITRVGGDRLEGIPQVEDVRRELLEKALRFYQGLLDQKGDDASLAFELARAELRVSELDFELGRIADSQRAAEGALARLQSLSAESVASPSRPFALDEERSRAHAQLGDVLRRQRELSAAATELRAAESLLARMLQDARSTAAHRFHLVLVREELAEVQRAEHDLAGAETTLRETHAMLVELARAEPGELAYASRLGRNMQLSGDVLHDMKRYADARAQHDDARRQFDDLLARHPGDVSLRELLAVSHSQIALDLQAERDLAPALEQYESALKILRDLAADFPRIPRYRVDICTYIDNMAAICVATEQPERVLPLYEEGIRGLERAVEGAPDVPSLRRRLLLAQANLCALLVQTGREDEAYARSQATIPSLRAELERAPGDVEVRAGLRVMSLNLADVLVARGDCAEAARVLDAAPPLATTDECMRSAALHALCCARLQDGKARVLALLDRAIESGFDDAESLANDRDFAALRTDPEFQARVERIRERARTRAK
jgi:tetratricopeptide (TPR) repeat protein